MPYRSVRALTLVGFWLTASLVALVAYVPTNDHFHRISAGRQIVRDGELPFRDFLDPGYFATELSSAAVQRVFGDNLLGEIRSQRRMHRHRGHAGAATGISRVRLMAPGDSGGRRSAPVAATGV
jgi:hypothetical protein